MRRIIARDEPLIREVWTRAQLIERWTKQGETFKAEWAAELPDDEELNVYTAGKGADAWLDMCLGPPHDPPRKHDCHHVQPTLVPGSHWRGHRNKARPQANSREMQQTT